jgi:catechol 2,3-dioxygenase-like lactoylglutathione lyase family enzyme
MGAAFGGHCPFHEEGLCEPCEPHETHTEIHGTPARRPALMGQSIGLIALVVRDYDEALEFYVGKLGFCVVEDTLIAAQQKRWLVIEPPGSNGARLLLARAVGEAQTLRIGDQTGGRVFLFLYTDDFSRDFRALQAKGIEFVREPKVESYGTVAVFKDLYGNLWDLLQPSRTSDAAR